MNALTAPRPQDVTAVESWLKGAGITKFQRATNGDTVSVSATVAQATKLLGVTIQNFLVTYANGNSETEMRMAAKPDLPPRVQAAIQSFSGISEP